MLTSEGPSYRTLRLTRPYGRVLLASTAALVILLAALEALGRTQVVQDALPYPVVIGNDDFGSKLLMLDRMTASSGAPDCFILGSSMVDYGFKPGSFEDSYQTATGVAAHCFNLAYAGIDSWSVSTLATALARRYHPRLIVYGLSFRDLIDDRYQPDIPWVDYEMGQPSLEGWLDAHSYAYRYSHTLRIIVRQDNWGVAHGLPLQPDGQHIKNNELTSQSMEVLSSSPYALWTRHYKLRPVDVKGLDQLLALNTPDQRVILVEMPLAPTVIESLPDGSRAHQVYADFVTASAASAGVPYLESYQVYHAPPSDWADPFHLSYKGSDTFSHWVGQQLANPAD